MQEKLIVRIFAVITAATGLFVIAKDWLAYLTLHQAFSRTFEMLGPLLTALGLLVMAVPVAKLIAAFGLFLSNVGGGSWRSPCSPWNFLSVSRSQSGCASSVLDIRQQPRHHMTPTQL
jgi:hypothetical protein